MQRSSKNPMTSDWSDTASLRLENKLRSFSAMYNNVDHALRLSTHPCTFIFQSFNLPV